MEKTKHTPGSWEIERCRSWMNEHSDYLNHTPYDQETKKQIVAMIESAPSLLMACKKYRAEFGKLQKMLGWKEGDCNLWAAPSLLAIDDLARAAIYKTEGRK